MLSRFAHCPSPGSDVPTNELRRAFEQASSEVWSLAERPDNDTLLKLYALYKQGSTGDICRACPGFFDFVGMAKHEAWSRLRGMARDEAMRRYVELVQQLRVLQPAPALHG